MDSPTVTALVAVVLVAAIVVAVARYELFCLRELAATRDDELRMLTRQGWFILIAFVIPVGGLLFFYGGRGGTGPGRA